jgi:hypothetical protein
MRLILWDFLTKRHYNINQFLIRVHVYLYICNYCRRFMGTKTVHFVWTGCIWNTCESKSPSKKTTRDSPELVSFNWLFIRHMQFMFNVKWSLDLKKNYYIHFYVDVQLLPIKKVLGVMVVNVTFNNISVILWWQVLLVKETEVPEKPRTCCKSWLTNFIT